MGKLRHGRNGDSQGGQVVMGRIFAAFFSLILPGLGQVFYGKFGAALFWWIASIFVGPIAGLGAAAHVMIAPE